jgi:hypothetical protein
MSDEMRGAPRPSCPRTKGFIERIARDAVTPADREHAAGCASCGPVLATAARFDVALRRSARGLVDEPLPDGIFDPAILPHRPGAAGRRALPDFAGIIAAVVILLMASSLGILPGGPSGTGGPNDSLGSNPTLGAPMNTGLGMRVTIFRSTLSLIRDLLELGYQCYPGKQLSGGPDNLEPEREGTVCKTGKDVTTYGAVIATRERGEGDLKEVVEVSVDGSLGGGDSARALIDLAQAFGKLTFLAIADEPTARDVAAWVIDAVPGLTVQAQGDQAENTVRGVQITLKRHPDGRFSLLLAAARP